MTVSTHVLTVFATNFRIPTSLGQYIKIELEYVKYCQSSIIIMFYIDDERLKTQVYQLSVNAITKE